jgi:hypothetical protein
VGVQAVLAWAFLFERAKQAFLGDVEGGTSMVAWKLLGGVSAMDTSALLALA